MVANTYTTWTPDLETGHAVIDEQHQKLIAAVNALFDAQRNGKGREEVEQTMDFLVDYTVKHFDGEEKLQEKHGYPHFFAHKQLHVDFKGVAHGLADDLRRDGPSEELVSHVCVTIGKWILNHIKAEDTKMVAHLLGKAPG